MNYTTIQEVKADAGYASGLEMLSDYGISLYLIYRGGSTVEYYCFHNRKLIFKGDDFKPSPLYSIDGIESLVDLLGFLTCKPGDTDPEYFKDYTEEQLAWANSWDCEQLSGLVSDFENSSEEAYREAAKEYFQDAYDKSFITNN